MAWLYAEDVLGSVADTQARIRGHLRSARVLEGRDCTLQLEQLDKAKFEAVADRIAGAAVIVAIQARFIEELRGRFPRTPIVFYNVTVDPVAT